MEMKNAKSNWVIVSEKYICKISMYRPDLQGTQFTTVTHDPRDTTMVLNVWFRRESNSRTTPWSIESCSGKGNHGRLDKQWGREYSEL
jgi:hypothetical protein